MNFGPVTTAGLLGLEGSLENVVIAVGQERDFTIYPVECDSVLHIDIRLKNLDLLDALHRMSPQRRVPRVFAQPIDRLKDFRLKGGLFFLKAANKCLGNPGSRH